jgi:hypothetical protein
MTTQDTELMKKAAQLLRLVAPHCMEDAHYFARGLTPDGRWTAWAMMKPDDEVLFSEVAHRLSVRDAINEFLQLVWSPGNRLNALEVLAREADTLSHVLHSGHILVACGGVRVQVPMAAIEENTRVDE